MQCITIKNDQKLKTDQNSDKICQKETLPLLKHGFLQGAATVKVTVESESEQEEGEEEEEVVVEVEQRPSSLSLQDRITERQFKHIQVGHIWLVPKLELFKCCGQDKAFWTSSVCFEELRACCVFVCVLLCMPCRWS